MTGPSGWTLQWTPLLDEADTFARNVTHSIGPIAADDGSTVMLGGGGPPTVPLSRPHATTAAAIRQALHRAFIGAPPRWYEASASRRRMQSRTQYLTFTIRRPANRANTSSVYSAMTGCNGRNADLGRM